MTDAELEAIATKVAAARTRLILDRPFLGALVLRLPIEAADPKWCPTTATDARKFFFNPEFIARLSLDETAFMLAHDALHCALSHFARRQGRLKSRWDRACDYAVNPLLQEEGLVPPAGSLVNPQYRGMTAEEIYHLLDDATQEEPLDRHVYDSENQQSSKDSGQRESDLDRQGQTAEQNSQEQEFGGGRAADSGRDQSKESKATPTETPSAGGAAEPRPLTPEQQETLKVQWQQRLAGAAQQAMQAGKLGANLARMIEHLLQPQLPWRMLLARYMTSVARADFSYSRPSRREGPFILPSLRSQQVDMVIAVDTSGSIQPQEIDEFLSEINAIKGQISARITLLACDAQLANNCPWIYEPWESFQLAIELRGGGGTAFEPVFDWVERQALHPDLLLYFTDAEGSFPKQEPLYPVIWLVKGKNKVPWGQRIQLN